ncbi:aminotransferase class V-fold PLP-dependent enzyme [Flexithrix dorotheae]|uniref:aminotransferase class V-fold PLP-dependent enzyme n=1 Tax=Flexithrix dorotheae TaxID=70993 RepID=UPI00037BCE1C|nr:aminotransferase class V-fold PLP-dependent enzyme [Flexithrix dorotheae]
MTKQQPDWNKIRENYPALEKGIFLNTATCGIMSKTTAEVGKQYFQEFAELGGLARNSWSKALEELKEQLRVMLKVKNGEISLIANFTLGINYLNWMLEKTSKKVLLLESDFPSVTSPWVKNNFHITYITADENGAFSPELIEQLIVENQIEILALSHIQFNTGFRADVEAVGKICQKHKVLFILDNTQSFSAFEIDVEKCHVDVLIASCYKWSTAGFGSGFMYLSHQVLEKYPAPVIGNNGMGVVIDAEKETDPKLKAKAFEIGHQNFSGLICLNQALKELDTIGFKNIQDRITALNQKLISRLKEIKGVKIVSNYPPENTSCIVVIEGNEEHEKLFAAKGIQVAARNKGLRISFHFYNSFEEMETFCKVASEIYN